MEIFNFFCQITYYSKLIIRYNYSKIWFHICIKYIIIESDKKIIEFFHKPYLYWDVCKYFILNVGLLITLQSTTKRYYWFQKNHIFINCTNMEYDKKAIAFFHKAHIYWDVWKYFILPLGILITLESTTKWYYWYQNKSHFHQLHKYGVW